MSVTKSESSGPGEIRGLKDDGCGICHHNRGELQKLKCHESKSFTWDLDQLCEGTRQVLAGPVGQGGLEEEKVQ